MLYVDSDPDSEIEHKVLRHLDTVAALVQDHRIDAILPIIAEQLNSCLEGRTPASAEDLAESQGYDSEGLHWSDDEDFEPFELKAAESSSSIKITGSLEMQKRDLSAAMMAGISFGVYDYSDSHYGTVSLSLPVSRWGVPAESLAAWDLTDTDYVVLLIKTCGGAYPSSTDYLCCQRPESLYRFALGKCGRPKPSEESAREAFMTQLSNLVPSKLAQRSGTDNDWFQPLYLFNPVERILQNDLRELIRRRLRDSHISWSEALTQRFLSETYANAESRDQPLGSRGPRLLQEHVMSSTESMSIPLIAMNCAVHLMVQCGQQCAICGRPMGADLETMRPYVCDRSLCLDQYFSLNLGPGIEHEVINNPHTVDLLVSFFYTALLSNRVRNFPRGLRLKGPGPIAPAGGSYLCANIEFDGTLGRATFLPVLLEHQRSWMTAGSKIVLLAAAPEHLEQNVKVQEQRKDFELNLSSDVLSTDFGTGAGATAATSRRKIGPWYHTTERYLCTLVDVGKTWFTFRVVSAWDRPVEPPSPAQGSAEFQKTTSLAIYAGQAMPSHPETHAAAIETLPSKMILLPFIQDVDDLSERERDAVLVTVLCGLPSILTLRKHLLDHPGQRLSASRQVIDSDTYRLLLWIVASNRSFIVQDEPVVPCESSRSESENAPNRVQGIGPGWLQFRFVQGSPEKEQRFLREVVKVDQDDHSRTVFAWHGSNLDAWHGIVSTGLNFNERRNGRSYGHGVYFSENMDTSLNYSRGAALGEWPNSDLKVTQAISMCEIINKKDQFVSTKPHLVVDQIDWVQCRFLFARINPTAAAVTPQASFPQGNRLNKPDQSGYLTHLEIFGSRRKRIQIPRSAVSLSANGELARANVETNDLSGTKKRISVHCHEGYVEDQDSGVDLDGVLVKRQEEGVDDDQSVQKRRRTAGETDFKPGVLDWASLPTLPSPQNPEKTAQQTLMKHFKHVQEVQESTDLADLGWYIDFENLGEGGNIFRWIVELHSFDGHLPLAKDMKKNDCRSIVLELSFGGTFPWAPPFARIIRPRFLDFAHGGGGNVTQGGAICSEMLVTDGWLPSYSIEKIIMQIRLQLCDMDRPARLLLNGPAAASDYSVGEAIDAYKRAASSHGWTVSADLNHIISGLTKGA